MVPAIMPEAALALAAGCETDCETKGDPLDERCRGCERTAASLLCRPLNPCSGSINRKSTQSAKSLRRWTHQTPRRPHRLNYARRHGGHPAGNAQELRACVPGVYAINRAGARCKDRARI